MSDANIRRVAQQAAQDALGGNDLLSLWEAGDAMELDQELTNDQLRAALDLALRAKAVLPEPEDGKPVVRLDQGSMESMHESYLEQINLMAEDLREAATLADLRLRALDAIASIHQKSTTVRVAPRSMRGPDDSGEAYYSCLECQCPWPCDTMEAMNVASD